MGDRLPRLHSDADVAALEAIPYAERIAAQSTFSSSP